MPAEVQLILEKLNHIQLDLDFLKEHLRDIDFVLTDDDWGALHQAEEDLKLGKTKRLI